MHLSQSSDLAKRSAYNGLKPGGVTVIVGAGAMGRMHVEIALSYHPRLVVVAKGGSLARGRCANALTSARLTDDGEGAALYEEPVRLRPR